MSDHALAIDYASLPDDKLVALARNGHHEAFRHIMQHCNQRLFRIARSVLNDDAEAEDALQEAYIRAFTRLGDFRGDASVRTWITRIVLNEAYSRLRRRHATTDLTQIEKTRPEETRVLNFPPRYGTEDPVNSVARAQLRKLAEHAIEALPEPFRVVFIMREIEQYDTRETAEALGIRAVTVKTRLYRARRQLHKTLKGAFATALDDAFPFLGPRCMHMTEAVLAHLKQADVETAGKNGHNHEKHASLTTPADRGLFTGADPIMPPTCHRYRGETHD